MSANIKVYDSPACIKELELSGAIYELLIGSSTGIDCKDTLVETSKDVWLKNVGTSPAMYVNIVKDGDDTNRLSLSYGTNSSSGSIALGSMAKGEVKQIRLTLKIPQGTPSGLYSLSLYIRYKSTP